MAAALVCRAHPRRLAVVLAAALSGCALSPPPTADELRQQALPHTTVPAAWAAAGAAAGSAAVDRWLATFGDPALSALVTEALAYNADLQSAAARVAQANGYVKVAGASLLPAVGVAGLTGDKSGGGGALEGLFLNASLELDVWGRVRYGAAAAARQSEAAVADFAYARQSLAATVAKSWFVAVQAGLQRAIVQDAVRSAETLQQLAQDRLRVGSGNEQAVAQARANVGSYRDSLRQVELGRQQALRALELLLGRYPSGEVAVAERLATMPPPVPVGLPSQLLERRPDVVAAERRVAAAFARVGEAKAARLPKISLTAGISSVSSGLLVLQSDHENPAWSVGANLLAPIYQGGALTAQVEIRTAEQQQAVADYARAGQRAFGEVENALAAEVALRDRDALLDATLRDNQRALELAQTQYRIGSADLRAVEQGQLALYAVRMTRLAVQTEQLAQRINLHLALGGGFDEAPVAVPGTTAATTAKATTRATMP